MRNKRALLNMASNIGLQFIIFISGFLIPRLILGTYGSSVNGLISSITQFLAYLGLAEAGVGAASTAALYTPIALNDQKSVNSILSATRLFYYRSGIVFLALVSIMIYGYPIVLSNQQSVSFIRMMIIILASSNVVDYFFLGKYKVFLTADQKSYIVANIQSFGTILNIVISVVLIYGKADVLIVKAVATAVYILRFFVVRYYVKKNYSTVDYHATPNFEGLGQRWAALLHQVTGIIVNNTDIVLLTLLLGEGSLLEVSVYTVYNMVSSAMYSLYSSFSNGLTAGFGELISRGEKENLKRSFSNYEYMFFIILFVGFTCVGTLLLPFVSVYTWGISDVKYSRPVVAILFTVIMLLQNIRTPGMTIICAKGHFRETRRQAVLEAVINIVVSLSLIHRYGMCGILFGTVCSYGYRSTEIIVYNARKLIQGTGRKTVERIMRNVIISCLMIYVGWMIIPKLMSSYLVWFGWAMGYGVIASIIVVLVNYFFEPTEFKVLMHRLMSVVKK